MEKNIEFLLKDSVKHTKEHCARVLLLALVIAHKIGLSDEGIGALGMAAIIFAWSTTPYRFEWKYDISAHKKILIDIGHVC